ncbi:MAG: methyltransferase domain-containing protein [Magnetovibrionaceae bacterium]
MTDDLCFHRTTCRLCGSEDLELVFGLAPTPPANAFVGEADLDKSQPRFPLDVYFCSQCGHVQLLDVVDPAHLFENYVYVSGTSPVFVKHFEGYADAVVTKTGAASGDLAVDIGSNDGTLLGFFKAHGLKVLGIDPAKDIAATATEQGIPTEAGFFTPDWAAKTRETKGPARIITANNVFAHIDDMEAVTTGIRTLLADDGVYVFEVSYLVDVIEKTLFDTIYHEHLAYHAVKPLKRFLAEQGLELFAAERVNSHGGSLRGYAQLANGPHRADGSVEALIALEAAMGLDKAETFRAFAGQINQRREELSGLLRQAKDEGRSVAAFGAPAKATTLMYHFGIGPEIIDFIVDDSPLKQGLYSPGMHIPVLPSSALYDRKPDDVVILAWNFAEAIAAKHTAFTADGGRFIVPLPTVEVLSP